VLRPEHASIARDLMCESNRIGAELGKMKAVHAMTDVTGFGLGGHLLEMCTGSGTHAELIADDLPVIPEALTYLKEGCYPDGSFRNWKSFSDRIAGAEALQRMMLLSDPQTSGGLLIAVAPSALAEVQKTLHATGRALKAIGKMTNNVNGSTMISIS
jgi:selenide,water dikinase